MQSSCRPFCVSAAFPLARTPSQLVPISGMQVVVPQGVLTRASAELTINEASAIADNTLEVSCRAILWALGAPEMLRASAGRGSPTINGTSSPGEQVAVHAQAVTA